MIRLTYDCVSLITNNKCLTYTNISRIHLRVPRVVYGYRGGAWCETVGVSDGTESTGPCWPGACWLSPL